MSLEQQVEKRFEIYKKAIDKWGVDKQLDMLIEEMAELTVALQHLRRGRPGAKDEVLEELADVNIVLSQVTIIFGKEGNEKFNEKMNRLEELLK